MKRFTACTLSAAALALLAGCASAPRMGAQPSDTPPRLVLTEKKDPSTGKLLLDWDRPGAFGAVNGTLKALGDGACMSARVDLEALGYHPKALDENGQPMNGGGFYCYPRKNGEKPDAIPPRLVYDAAADGSGRRLLAWDRPGAFGKVPAELQARGDVACLLADIALEAIAYHPKARDVDGQALSGGGFYCWRKKRGTAPAEESPRLVRQGGQLTWDRPRAFGAVPPERQSAGDRVCGAQQQAIGYHPSVLDEEGRLIEGGGFFCGPRTNDGVKRRT